MEMQSKPLNEENDYYPPPCFDNSNNQNPSNNGITPYTNNPSVIQTQPQPNPQNIGQEYYAPQISPQGYNQYQQINPQVNNQVCNQPIQIQEINYANYTNVNQVHNQGIHQIDSNNIYLSLGCCFKVLPIILFLCGVACSLSAFSYGFGGYIACGIGIIFLIISIVWGCKNYYSIYFIMGDSALTMIKKALFRRKTKIFRFGELHSIELKEIVAKGKRSFHYVLDVTYTNMSSQTEFHEDSGVPLFTHEEMGFFNYIINRHIQTKMRR